MDKIWHNLKLDLADGGSQGEISVRANDAATQVLSIQLRTGGRAYQLAEDVVATLHGTRRDGTMLYNACYIEDNCIRMELKSELLGVAGRVECVIKLVGTEPAALTTPGFDIYVEAVPDDAKIEASDSFGALVEQTAKTKALQMEIEQKLADGEFDGEDGYSPEVTVTPIEDGYRLDVQNKDTEYSVDIIAPEKGEQGVGIASAVLNADYTLTLYFTDGSKYTTPSIRGGKGDPGISVTHSWNGTVLTITSASGTSSADLKGGKGDDGISPILSAAQISGGHRVSMQDKDGTKTFDVMDGKNGDNGVTPAFSIGTVTTLAAGSNATASIGGTVDKPVLNLGIPKGADGKDGEDAEGGGGTMNHADLTNRDAADQHPMGAISGLAEALAGKQPAGDYLKNGDVPAWAMEEDKPSYTAKEVGALSADTPIPDELGDLKGDASHRTVTDAQIATWNAKSNFSGEYSDLKNIPEAPVTSVNGKTGAVKLDAAAVGARADNWMPTPAQVGAHPDTWMPTAAQVGAHPNTWMPTPAQVGADPTGTATSAVSSHNTNKDSHNDIRLLIAELTAKVTNFLDVDDTSRDQLSELLALIDDHAGDLEAITNGKLNKSDVINNLTTNSSEKALSAAQGVVLKALYDAIPSWALADLKPSYNKSEVGLGDVDNVKQYSANNPPPYPVTSVNGKTGAVTLSIPDSLSDLAADSTHRVVTDTQIAAWNGKLNASELGDAVDDALAQAKASGEFNGADGERGTGILKITTAPSSYTTATGGFTPTYRVALSTVKTQAKVDKVLVGDTVAYNYYQYPVGYVDASYAYLGARTSVRGAAGTTPVKGTDYYTDADKAEMVTQVKAALPTLTVTGVDADGTTHTWTMYGVKN